ncbi:uncharacterized protein N7484_004519 [Penicillium longicatenatum]|uniref:uncharacterized protein n=1 Tax=Penicillium longicatenatum TaxID=1561947 RepID=UPI0025499E29|nr:uncharacterized protein N7484_004519 [Penicillium longicatenatum]KAJ5650796.1 hypothetical protein N7484_004519 [Penicillium longicatenatum]
MASPPEAIKKDPLEAHTHLLEWVCSQGGHINDSVCIAHDDQRGVHLQVKADWPTTVPKETRVINAPLGVTMSYFNAVDYSSAKGSFSSHGVKLPQAFIDDVGLAETMTFFLIAHFLRGEQSFWYPYLQTLPQPGQMTTPLFFGEEDVDWLQGTGIPDASVSRYRDWDKQYDLSIEKLEQAGFEGFEAFTWDLYLWAWTILTSRAFSAKVLSSAVEDADLPEEGISVLLPLIDLPNHRPLAKVEWRAGEEDVGMIILEDASPGQEISNNYGPRNNEQLLMNYGFTITNNPTDYRIVKLGVAPDSALGEAKARQIQMFPQIAAKTDDHYYIFNVSYPLLAPQGPMEHAIISPALLNALTIMEANDRERKKILIEETSISIQETYGTSRSTLAALSQTCLELIAHILQLQASAQDLPSEPANLKQIFAKIYREGQITIDKTALIIASWTIARAREHERDESWEGTKALLNEHISKIPPGTFSDEILSRTKVRIIERQSLIPKNGELFRLAELFRLLPKDLQVPSQKYFIGRVANGPWSTDPQVMFALAINFLVATATTEDQEVQPLLSSRLTQWVEFLINVYPLPTGGADERVSAAQQLLQALSKDRDGFLQLAEQDGVTWLPSASKWLSPDWLQWACIVGDAERVLIPVEPLQVLVTDEPTMAKQAVLYVPQL